MTSPKLVVLAGVLALAGPSSAAAATTCGSSKPHGVTGVAATGVSCKSALAVARNYNYYAKTPSKMNRWACKGKRVSSTREKVTCRKGARRVTFRSTYVMELPAAPAPPAAAGAGS